MLQLPALTPARFRRSARRYLLHTLAISTAVAFALQVLDQTTVAADQTARPNVVLIMTDDQGYGDFGATGNKVIKTPNIDGLAARSASMSTFYVSPVCSPTRACLMTGRYNYRTRCIDTWLGRSMMDPAEVTVAELLSGAGYDTGIFGKWHLGDCHPMRPIDQGFTSSLVHRGGGLAQPSEPRENNRRYTDPILFRNGQQVQTTGYCTDVYFDAAMQFMEDAHQGGRPFFVYLPTNAPHGPYHDVPEDLRADYMKQDLASLMVRKPRRQQAVATEMDRLARVAAMITNVDQNVGRLLKKLGALDVMDNTLVIVMVDNGPNTLRYVSNMRGMKTHVHDGGVRSPVWMQWPARLKAGTTRSEIAAHIDLMPTILDACQVEPPNDLKLDGRSLLPLLENKTVQWPERTLVIQSHRGDEPVRYHHFMIRDQRWKLLHASGFGRESFEGPPKFELYDMAADPGETQNLVEQQPEVLGRLKRAYDQWFDDVSSTRPNNYHPPRIHIGTEHENPTVLTRQDWRGGTWAADSNGFWELHVAASAEFDIEVNFDPKPVAGRVTLEVGELSSTKQVEPGSTSCVFAGAALRKGHTRLSAHILEDGKRRGVYQVSVHQQ